jgi:hypothetical protein
MYYLPPKENVKLELAPRKVNSFYVPVKINGVILIECSDDKPIKNLQVFRNNEEVHSISTCTSPVVLDHMKPGIYKARYKVNRKKMVKKFFIDKDNSYFHSLVFQL